MLYAVTSIHPVKPGMWNSSFTFSGDQCCQRSSVGFGGFFASNPGCKFEGFFVGNLLKLKKCCMNRGGDWNVYILYMFIFIYYIYIYIGGMDSSYCFLKAFR